MPIGSDAPFTCPACGEDRLIDGDATAWACRVCGKDGRRRVAGVAPAADPLEALLVAVVRHHLTPGPWQVVAVAPLAHLPRPLQRELTLTLGAQPESVVLVLERVGGEEWTEHQRRD